MSFITCVKCGKTYDFDKTYGICPKCSRFNNIRSSQKLHAEMHEQLDRGMKHEQLHGKYDTVHQGEYHYNGEMSSQSRPANDRRKQGSFVKTMIGFIFAIIAFFTVMTILMIFMFAL